ncbi:MAG: UvrB/UvrC motif-containing protein [Clostridia bacterium]|nr:UvrB/UvrC motif-containing protein [Clostridia bacterium]
MKCQKCGKREATTHMTKIINGYKEEMHLCSECAAESAEYKSMKSDMNVGIGDFLLGIIGGNKNKQAAGLSEHNSDVCPTCHMTYADFLNTGKLGCGDCYTAFESRLMRPIRQIHGTCEHVGKVPVRGGGGVVLSKKISKLEEQLNAAVLKQDFETAAKLRDEIKDLKSKDEKGE